MNLELLSSASRLARQWVCWRVVRRRGSHVQYRHPDNPNVVTLAGHDGDDITPGQLSDIRRKTRLPLR